MSDQSDGTPTRTRGRPPAREAADTRERILDTARTLFAENGFDGTTVRSIAATAGVDPGLVRHYFGDKRALLVATMALPLDPRRIIAAVFADGSTGLGQRMLETFLTTWDAHPDILRGLLRTAVSNEGQSAPAVAVISSILLPQLMRVMSGEDVAERAELVVSQLIGLAILRYVLALAPLRDADVATVTRWYAPRLQALITPSAKLS